MFAGVCGGIAETLGMRPAAVRVVAVLIGVLTPCPVPLVYLAAVVLLKPDTALAPETVEVTWLPDGLRVAWSGPFLPHVISWRRWLFGVAAIGAVVALATAPLMAHDAAGAVRVLSMASSLIVPLGLVVTLPFLTPRRYALTVTHDALLVDRPFLPTERVELADLKGLRQGTTALEVTRNDRHTLRLQTPPPNDAFFELHDQLDRARERSLGHRQDLAEQEPERRKIAAVLSAGDPHDDPG